MVVEDWKSTTLGEVITLQRGYDLPSRDRRPGNVPVVTSSGFGGTHSEPRAKGPGVVIGRYGTIGEVFFIKEDFWPHNTTLYVKDFKGNDPLFVSFLLHSIDMRSFSGKTGVPGVNRNDLHSIKLTIPRLPEQHAIAAALSDVDVLIGALDVLTAKKRNIKQGALQGLLTGKKRLAGFHDEWAEHRLEDVFRFLPTGNNTRGELSSEGDAKYIHYGDIHTKWSTFLDCRDEPIPKIDSNTVKRLPSLEDGDVVMADVSEDYGGLGTAVEVMNVGNARVVAGLHTLLLRSDKSVVADGFKGYLFQMKVIHDQLVRVATGISVYGITKKSIQDVVFPVPSIREQQAIAEVLSDMDAEIAGLERKRGKYRAIKQGMMQELLTGRTRLV